MSPEFAQVHDGLVTTCFERARGARTSSVRERGTSETDMSLAMCRRLKSCLWLIRLPDAVPGQDQDPSKETIVDVAHCMLLASPWQLKIGKTSINSLVQPTEIGWRRNGLKKVQRAPSKWCNVLNVGFGSHIYHAAASPLPPSGQNLVKPSLAGVLITEDSWDWICWNQVIWNATRVWE